MARKGECTDPIKEVRVFHYPNAVFTVRIPDLTPEERARRMQQIKEAAENLLVNGRLSEEQIEKVRRTKYQSRRKSS